MAKGLFATENDDLGTDVSEDMNVSPEAGVAAEVEAETQAEVADIGADAEAIDDGSTAGEQLEEVQDTLEEAVESGEGLSPIAAEGIRMAIAAICKPIHADPKRVYSLYARESFQAESSRLANTQFALEGVKEFLTDLYKRIKAALERLWNKVKAFWDKHISNLGRVKKAIDSMQKKVKTVKKLKGTPVVDSIPSSMARAFGVKGQLKSSDVTKVIAAAVGFQTEISKELSDATQEAAPVGTTNTVLTLSPVKKGGLVNGVSIEVKVENNSDGETESFSIEREDSEEETDGSKGMVVAPVAELTTVLSAAATAVAGAIACRKNYDTDVAKMGKALQALGGRLQGMKTETKDEQAAVETTRKQLTKLSKFSSFHAKAHATASVELVKAAKAALTYVAFNLKHYETK